MEFLELTLAQWRQIAEQSGSKTLKDFVDMFANTDGREIFVLQPNSPDVEASQQEEDPDLDYRVRPAVQYYPPREVTDIERLSWSL